MRSGSGRAQRVQDAAPEGRTVRTVAAPAEDSAVAPDPDVRRLGADVVVADERRGAFGEDPVVALALGVRVQPGCVLVEGDVDELDIVLVVVVEGVQRASLAAAVRSPGGEEVEEDGATSCGGLDGGRGAVGERQRGVGCAFADVGAGGDVGAPAAGGRRLRRWRVRRERSGRVGRLRPWRGCVRWARCGGWRGCIGRLRLRCRGRLCQHTLNRTCPGQQVRGSGRLRNGRRRVGGGWRGGVGGNRRGRVRRDRCRSVLRLSDDSYFVGGAGGERKHEQHGGEQGDAPRGACVFPRGCCALKRGTLLLSVQHDNQLFTPILALPHQGGRDQTGCSPSLLFYALLDGADSRAFGRGDIPEGDKLRGDDEALVVLEAREAGDERDAGVV